MIKVFFDNGNFWQEDSETKRRVKLWSQASCKAKIVKLLQGLSEDEREARKQLTEFCDKAAAYAKGCEGDDFESKAALNNVIILFYEFSVLTGAKEDLVFIC